MSKIDNNFVKNSKLDAEMICLQLAKREVIIINGHCLSMNKPC